MSIQLNQFPNVFTQSFYKDGVCKFDVAYKWIKDKVGYPPTISASDVNGGCIWINSNQLGLIECISKKYPAKVMPMPSDAMLEICLNSRLYSDDEAELVYLQFTSDDHNILNALNIHGFISLWCDDSVHKLTAAYGISIPNLSDYEQIELVKYGSSQSPCIENRELYLYVKEKLDENTLTSSNFEWLKNKSLKVPSNCHNTLNEVLSCLARGVDVIILD